MKISLDGHWQVQIDDGKTYDAQLPGTLDTNNIGYKEKGAAKWHPGVSLDNLKMISGDTDVIGTRFTRKHTFEGVATFSKQIDYLPRVGKRVFLEVERARCLKMLIDEQEIPNFTPPSISTPHIFEVTGLLAGSHELKLISDNRYLGLPRDAILTSSAATDETQTNWNGMIGYIRLREEDPVFLSNVRIYPKENSVTVCLEVAANQIYEGSIVVTSNALIESATLDISVEAGIHEFIIKDLPLKSDVRRWDEFESHLYELTISLTGFGAKTETFGIRDFGSNEKGRLTINNRVIFVRSETNCAVFPKTGHPPMTVSEWEEVLNVYKSYGVNLMRFHSHCPPKAAFIAADQMGMMMQPELSHWNPQDAFESDESVDYYRMELIQIIKYLANHPSFVMFAFGNELHASDLGHERMTNMLKMIKKVDETRLFASGSNNHYGDKGCDLESDFSSMMKFYDKHLRAASPGWDERGKIVGFINEKYPNAMENFDDAMEDLRKTYQKPFFCFEVGQFEILPDFDEIDDFNGVVLPENFKLIRARVEKAGYMLIWKKYIEATGELSLLCYRAEVEAALRTESFSGLSLLGLQDFPGQGTALVGMLNSHLKPKPYPFAQPEKFASFFNSQLPLVLLPKYTFDNSETLVAEIKIANYGKEVIEGKLCYTLHGENIEISNEIAHITAKVGHLSTVGTIKLPLAEIKQATRLDLTVKIGNLKNTYPIWVYPVTTPVCSTSIYETTYLNEKALEILENGGTVYLSPPSTKEALPHSIQGQFSTDFWSVGTFQHQPGGMGLLINQNHPIFKNFPTDTYTNWQWWLMASQRAVILPELMETIITQLDSYAYLRSMSMLLEGRVGNGKLLFSTMGLQDLQQYPEARALLHSIYTYMTSTNFAPKQILSINLLQELIKN